MDSQSHLENPDKDNGEDLMEQETPDIDFDGINENGDNEVVNHTENNTEQFNADASDIDDLDEPDQYVEEDDENSEQISSKTNGTKAGEKSNGEPKSSKDTGDKLIHLPSARVKHIMKVDPEVSLITGECTFLVTKATELFIESLAREAFLHTSQAKKKTVQKRDVDAAIENVESLMFLEGMMNF